MRLNETRILKPAANVWIMFLSGLTIFDQRGGEVSPNAEGKM